MQRDHFSLFPCPDYCGRLLACSRSDLPSSLGSLCSKQGLEVSLKGRRDAALLLQTLHSCSESKPKPLWWMAWKNALHRYTGHLHCFCPQTLLSRLPRSSLPSSDCSNVTSSVRPSWPPYLKFQLPPTLFPTSSPHSLILFPAFFFIHSTNHTVHCNIPLCVYCLALPTTAWAS